MKIATKRLVREVCMELIWASWLESVSTKAKAEIVGAVRKLEKHFEILPCNVTRDLRTWKPNGHAERVQKRAKRLAFVRANLHLTDAEITERIKPLYSPKTYGGDIERFVERMRATLTAK